jgi:hypothetical protein
VLERVGGSKRKRYRRRYRWAVNLKKQRHL